MGSNCSNYSILILSIITKTNRVCGKICLLLENLCKELNSRTVYPGSQLYLHCQTIIYHTNWVNFGIQLTKSCVEYHILTPSLHCNISMGLLTLHFMTFETCQVTPGLISIHSISYIIVSIVDIISKTNITWQIRSISFL